MATERPGPGTDGGGAAERGDSRTLLRAQTSTARSGLGSPSAHGACRPEVGVPGAGDGVVPRGASLSLSECMLKQTGVSRGPAGAGGPSGLTAGGEQRTPPGRVSVGPSGSVEEAATLRSGWQGAEEQAWHTWVWEVSSRRKDAATGWRLCLRPPSRRTRPAAHCPVSHMTRESQNAAALGRARPRAQPQRPVWGVRLRAAQSGAPGAWGTAGGRRAAGHPRAKTTVPREGRRREEDGAPGSVGPQRAAVSWACTGAPLPPEGRPWLATPDL